MKAIRLVSQVVTGLALATAPAWAQAHAGVYDVAGSEAGRGAFAGQVELRWDGQGYAFTRDVEYSAWTHQGRPVSSAWSGRARDAGGGGLVVDVLLDRMGWIAEVPGLPPRTAADGAPMAVRGTFAPATGRLSGTFVGQGAPFVDPAESWTRAGAPGALPRWRDERERRPTHRDPSWLERRLLFALYGSFHRLPWVAPYAGRPEFQRGVHFAVFDRTDQDLLRRRPDLLRVVQRVVDPLTLEEAKVKADALGRALRTKAEAADLELPRRYMDASGALQHLAGATPIEDNDGCLWTGVYALTQAVRHGLTQEPAAAQNVERTVRGLLGHMAITGSPTEFARTLRAARGAGGRWHAGSGVYAGVEWKDGGNNDMFKGLLLGGVAAHEALAGPAHAGLRAGYARALEGLADHHPVAQGNWHKTGNPVMVRGVIALLSGSSAARDAYRRKARNPLHLLYSALGGGGLMHLGQQRPSGRRDEGLARRGEVGLERPGEGAVGVHVDRAHDRRAVPQQALLGERRPGREQVHDRAGRRAGHDAGEQRGHAGDPARGLAGDRGRAAAPAAGGERRDQGQDRPRRDAKHEAPPWPPPSRARCQPQPPAPQRPRAGVPLDRAGADGIREDP